MKTLLSKFKYVTYNYRRQHTWIKPTGYNTGINVYNCITKDKVPFIVPNKELVTWYTCGPTVYDSSHIGHASCYVKLDIIQRILKEHFNLTLVTVMNITDIDDKIIQKSNYLKVSPLKVAQDYENEFWNDLSCLNVIKPNLVLRVTENMPIIIKFIQHLLNSDYAYKTQDGSVYLNVKKQSNYGKLQNISTDNFIEEHSEKRNAADFALWKGAKPDEPFWDTEWGRGRPGWHTECSALAGTALGSAIDVHAGGIDLRFPHHENEEAQCCLFFSKQQWVNYWFHTGHLHLRDSVKMSKSLKNTVTIQELLTSCDVNTFRMMCLMSPYRSNIEFSNDFMELAKNMLRNYKFFLSNCSTFLKGQLKSNIDEDVLRNFLKDAINKVNEALRDDFDTASVVKIIANLITVTNKMLHLQSDANDALKGSSVLIGILNFVVNTFDMFGVNLDASLINEKSHYTDIVDVLVIFRQNVRQLGIANKDRSVLELCDKVRQDLRNSGITISDHGKLSSWSKL